MKRTCSFGNSRFKRETAFLTQKNAVFLNVRAVALFLLFVLDLKHRSSAGVGFFIPNPVSFR